MRYIKKFSQIFETLNASSGNESELKDLFLDISDKYHMSEVNLLDHKKYTTDTAYSLIFQELKKRNEPYRYSFIDVNDYTLLVIYSKMKNGGFENMNDILIDMQDFLGKLDQFGYSGEYIKFNNDFNTGKTLLSSHNYYSDHTKTMDIILKISKY